MKNKEIRFITSNYDTLFTIPDGEYITVTQQKDEIYPDFQEQWIGQCKYIDEAHTEINGDTWHICQFAEKQEQIGSKIEPTPKPEIIGGYRITARKFVKDKVFKLGHNPDAVEPYGTWMCFIGEDDRNSFGHYWKERSAANRDFFLRADSERLGIEYDHTTLYKK